ncbi:cation:proton antiporter, partial [Nodularia sp. UHCC 0506]|uniref:cation:proton antiporter n=1 Tax=Nodularia sp. UHCC 0506 TaxID=3110243 RepID=UPI002B203A14
MTSNLLDSPIIQFTILLTVIFTIPPIFERLRLPGLVGLLVAGMVLGQNGLKLLDTNSETIKLLSDIGKVYLMFVAGLEIDLGQFRKTKNRSIVFGFFTFIFPLIAGICVGRLFGFSWNASVLIGSLLASHTLLAYPIVSRLGVVMNESVTVTVGATIFTDTAALLVLAICVGIHRGEFSAISLVTLLSGLTIYSAIVFFGFDWAGKEFFRRSGDEQSNQFLFILLALFLASVGAQIVGVEKIVGAFLAGLAVNDVVGRSPVKEKIEFIGSVLFIPCFFVDMGLLINIPAFIKTLGSIWLTVVIVLALISSKFIAAFLTKLIYRYNTAQMLTMWSLSLPQVAATLAAALVAYQTLNPAGERLISEGVLNSVIVLMLVTSIMGPLITSRFAALLQMPQTDLEAENISTWWENYDSQPPEKTQ